MNNIYDVRGNHGSGKSTLVRNILKRNQNELILDEEIPYHLVPEFNLCIVGRYDRRGGGVDAISKSSDELQSFIEKKVKAHNVLFEGIITSEVYTRWNELAEGTDYNYTFFFLNVDLDTSIERVEQRRLAAGNSKEFNHKNITAKYVQIGRAINKLRESGKTVYELKTPSQKEAYQAIMKLIRRGSKC